MKQYSQTEHLSFDDILLVPQHSDIESRRDVSLATGLGNGLELSIPVIAAPMDTVCEWQMVEAMDRLGGMGILHRYMSIEQQVAMLKMSQAQSGVKNIGGSVGARGAFVEEAQKLVHAGANVILIDVANGHNQNAINAVSSLRKELGEKIHIMAGNVATWDGFARLGDAGADSVRVGIGGGSACTTRVVSAHGVPTLASVMNIREKFSIGEGPGLVADGGIRNSGDAAKALAAGANAVMVGRILAGTEESPGDALDGYKVFRGMASKEAQEAGRGVVSGVEGISTRVPFVGPVDNIINDFKNGLRSALSYTGVDNLIDFHLDSMYNKVSSNSLQETKPHAKE